MANRAVRASCPPIPPLISNSVLSIPLRPIPFLAITAGPASSYPSASTSSHSPSTRTYTGEIQAAWHEQCKPPSILTPSISLAQRWGLADALPPPTCLVPSSSLSATLTPRTSPCAFRLAQRWGLTDGRSVEQTEADLKALLPEAQWRDVHLQIIYFGAAIQRSACFVYRSLVFVLFCCRWSAT